MADSSHSAVVLLVEDDAALRELIEGRLRESGFEVRTAGSGPAALAEVERQLPDLVLLDIMLPGLDGLEVCRRLRSEHPLLHIIMLTARSDELDRVVGLEVGADDYITKPFSLQELVARTRAAARRLRATRERIAPSEGDGEEVYTFGDVRIDVPRREVTRNGSDVHLTVREFDLLVHLARHADRPFTRMQLLEEIWDETFEGYARTIDSHVQRLRAKIEAEPGNPRLIRTVWGVGYKLATEAE